MTGFPPCRLRSTPCLDLATLARVPFAPRASPSLPGIEKVNRKKRGMAFAIPRLSGHGTSALERVFKGKF